MINSQNLYERLHITLAQIGCNLSNLQLQPEFHNNQNIVSELKDLESRVGSWFRLMDGSSSGERLKFTKLALQNSTNSFLMLNTCFLELELDQLALSKETNFLVVETENKINLLISLMDYFDTED